jgi:hypothetical protein
MERSFLVKEGCVRERKTVAATTAIPLFSLGVAEMRGEEALLRANRCFSVKIRRRKHLKRPLVTVPLLPHRRTSLIHTKGRSYLFSFVVLL